MEHRHESPSCPNPTKYELKLYRALKENGLECELKYRNGDRIADIAIPSSGTFIHVDGRVEGRQFSNKTDGSNESAAGDEADNIILSVDSESIRNSLEDVVGWIAGHANRKPH